MTPPKLFPVQENPNYGIFPGTMDDGHPVISFVGVREIVMAHFTADGNFSKATVSESPPKVQPEDGSIESRRQACEKGLELLLAHLRTLGIVSFETVLVQKFWVQGQAIGVTQYDATFAVVLEPDEREYEDVDPSPLPPYQRDFLESDVTFDEEELEELRADLQAWRERGDFVLYHGNDYWCRPDGKIYSS